MIDINGVYPENWKDLLRTQGHFAVNQILCDTARKFIHREDWQALDDYFKILTHKDGAIFNFMSQFANFEAIEFIISIRDARNDWEEDGIWHDDGSRKLAFSLSLMESPQDIEGGILEIRKKGQKDSFKIGPFEYGNIIVFATGVDNFEHKINKVSLGRRIIIAGWCE